jgi:hypothetical protein
MPTDDEKPTAPPPKDPHSAETVVKEASPEFLAAISPREGASPLQSSRAAEEASAEAQTVRPTPKVQPVSAHDPLPQPVVAPSAPSPFRLLVLVVVLAVGALMFALGRSL